MDLLTASAGLLRALTLLAGLLLGGIAGASILLRRLGVPAPVIERAGCRLAGPLLGLLLVAALPVAVVETLWETYEPLDWVLLTDLLPYVVTTTLFGIIWAVHLAVLAVLLARLRAGHAPGLMGAGALLAAWPQIGHLTPPYDLWDPDNLLELGWLAAHRSGAALWFGALAVLLLWSRPGGPADRPWAVAFFRLALPGAALLASGAIGLVVGHGGLAAMIGPSLFPVLVQLKIGLLLFLVGLGALHFWRFRQPTAPVRRATIALEVAGAAAAAILGAVLGVLPSPVGHGF